MQWVKNVFVFLPMFFARELLDPECWAESVVAFFAFSFAASAIYCINDIRDIDVDRLHPVKRLRPLAAGKVTVTGALALTVLLVCVSFALSLGLLPRGGGMHAVPGVAIIIAIYLLLNLAYTFRLKHIAIVDVFVIATGFVLRLFAGGTACGIRLSPWIVCLTFLISLFFAFAKRRDDVVLMERGIKVRKNVAGYNLRFLDQTLGVLAAVTIVCYIMYTVSPEVIDRMGSRYLYLTSIFVLAGILRYLQLTVVEQESGSPTKVILTDKFLGICVLGWLLLFGVIIYI